MTIFPYTRLFLFCMLVAVAGHAGAQVEQTVRGRVVQPNGQPLEGASVQLQRQADTVTVTTDSLGRFFMTAPALRYLLRVTFVGFRPHEQELLVSAGKATALEITLTESTTALAGVEITAPSNLSSGSGRIAIPIEKALRLPASYFDPLRAALSHPGIAQASDQANSLIIRGASPTGILWRLNGLDILNPNHLANAGTLSDKPVTSGGGVNMLSAQMLDNTQLIVSAAPATYGNYAAGVMDMQLRDGNRYEHEYTAQVSLLGIDGAAEGPLSATHNSSYLINYRYSTLGLLSQMGIPLGDEQIDFQDLSFQLAWHKPKSHTQWFGVGGTSRNDFEAKPLDEREVEKDAFTIRYRQQGFTTGVLHKHHGQRTTWTVGAAVSAKEQDRAARTDQPFVFGVTQDAFEAVDQLVSGTVMGETALSGRWRISYGAMVSWQQWQQVVSAEGNPSTARRDVTVRHQLYQPWAAAHVMLRDGLTLETGLRAHIARGSAASQLNPRVLLTWQKPRSTWTLSSALNSQTQPLVVLGDNPLLKPIRTWFSNLSHALPWGNGWRWTNQAYYHVFDEVAGLPGTNTSLFNFFDEAITAGLTNSAAGRVAGWETLAEKRFQHQLYVMAGGSLFRSRYRVGESAWRSSRFDGGYTANVSGGKEWTRKKEKTFGLHLRSLALGGQRTTPIVVGTDGVPRADDANAFAQPLGDYVRLDARLVWRKNKPGYTRSLSLDIQNVLNIQNDGFQYYDRLQQRVVIQRQLGIIPILAYRVDF